MFFFIITEYNNPKQGDQVISHMSDGYYKLRWK